MDLNTRTTRKFADGYASLDKWESIGSIEEIGRKTETPADDDGDLTEPQTTTIHAIITSDKTDYQIMGAIHDTYTVSDCRHEWDCCGCRSFRVRNAKRVTGDLWCVEVGSSRNY